MAAQQDREYQEFLAEYGGHYESAYLDKLRRSKKGFARLDESGEVYLDYTGGSLHPVKLLKKHHKLLAKETFGNPHSTNPTSERSTRNMIECRARVLEHLNASEKEYDVVFTANASAALKLVGESFPFVPAAVADEDNPSDWDAQNRFVYLADDHNSVLGIREYARARQESQARLYALVNGLEKRPAVEPRYVKLDDRWTVSRQRLREELPQLTEGQEGLFAFPAQSNFSGVQHDPGLVGVAHERGWKVLLDAAAYMPTNRLDLGADQPHRPDFVAFSFYKMFGYPTGIGALVAKKLDLIRVLVRPWFAGGTVDEVTVESQHHVLCRGHAGFEDGTVDYLDFPAVVNGLDFLASCGVETIGRRVKALTVWLIRQLEAMEGVVEVHGPPLPEGAAALEAHRGGTVAFSVLADGKKVPAGDVVAAASQRSISLRSGVFCNPGCGEKTAQEHQGEEWSKSAVRVSMGVASNFADVQKFVHFLREEYANKPREMAAV